MVAVTVIMQGGDRILRPYLSTDMAERLLDRNAKLIAGILRLRASANDAHQRDGSGTENGDPAAAKRFDRRADRLEDQLARNLAALARWASKVKSPPARHSLCSGIHGRVHLDPRAGRSHPHSRRASSSRGASYSGTTRKRCRAGRREFSSRCSPERT